MRFAIVALWYQYHKFLIARQARTAPKDVKA